MAPHKQHWSTATMRVSVVALAFGVVLLLIGADPDRRGFLLMGGMLLVIGIVLAFVAIIGNTFSKH